MASDIEQRWRDLGEFIREQRRSGQLSLRKLSEKAGVSNPYLSQIERGLRKPSAEILQQIANALQISAETLYVRAGILEARDDSFDLVADIRRDPHLTEEQKKTLVHIYESFRGEHGRASAATGDTAAGAQADEVPSAEAATGDAPAGDSAGGDSAAGEPAAGEPAAGDSAAGDSAAGGGSNDASGPSSDAEPVVRETAEA
jgi:transcriptional regulator with XRE-family HTH domain